MRIESVDAFAVESALPYAYGISRLLQTHRRSTLVRVRTTDGIEGWGEASGEPRAAVDAITGPLASWLRNRELAGPEEAAPSLAAAAPDLPNAAGALDTALWDALARTRGVPLAEALGGARRRSFPAYAASGYYTSGPVDRGAQLVELAERHIAEGFRAVKVKIGRLPVAEDAAALRRLRAAVGPDIRLMADANEGYGADLDRALAMAEALAGIGAYWFEEPLSTAHPGLYAQLRSRSTVPIAGGEHLITLAAIGRMLDAGAYDIVQPDVAWAGGVSGYRAIAAAAQRAGVHCAPHVWGLPVSFAATLHVLAAHAHGSPRFDPPMLEYDQGPFPAREALGTRAPVDARGQVHLPEGAGIGCVPRVDRLTPYLPAAAAG